MKLKITLLACLLVPAVSYSNPSRTVFLDDSLKAKLSSKSIRLVAYSQNVGYIKFKPPVGDGVMWAKLTDKAGTTIYYKIGMPIIPGAYLVELETKFGNKPYKVVMDIKKGVNNLPIQFNPIKNTEIQPAVRELSLLEKTLQEKVNIDDHDFIEKKENITSTSDVIYTSPVFPLYIKTYPTNAKILIANKGTYSYGDKVKLGVVKLVVTKKGYHTDHLRIKHVRTDKAHIIKLHKKE